MRSNLKAALEFAFAALVLIFMLWPWTLALADLAHWAVFGNPLTYIPWRSLRGVVLLLWPFAVSAAIAMLPF